MDTDELIQALAEAIAESSNPRAELIRVADQLVKAVQELAPDVAEPANIMHATPLDFRDCGE